MFPWVPFDSTLVFSPCIMYNHEMSLFLPIIKSFNTFGVTYVAVGGIAVILHGHSRLTTDLDFVIDLSPENVALAMSALSSEGLICKVPIRLEDFGSEEIRHSWIKDKGMRVLGFTKSNNPLISVDIFVEYPVEFSLLYKDSANVQLGAEFIRVCSLEHLLLMKAEAGRPKDLEDLRILNLIKDRKKL